MQEWISITEFNRLIPNEDTCLDVLFTLHFNKKPCPICKHQKFHRVKGRACFECGKCGKQIYPRTKAPIIHRSRYPIKLWLDAIYYMVTLPSLSSETLAKLLGLSQPRAWGLLKKIQITMKENTSVKFSGTIEVDVTYIGGKKKAPNGTKKIGYNGRENKIVVFGMREKESGEIRMFPVKAESAAEILPLITSNVKPGSMIYSDEAGVYKLVVNYGYRHDFVRHKDFEWKKGLVTIQRTESVWSYIKKNLRGGHVFISKKHIRGFLDEQEFRYNHCHSGSWENFFILVGRLFAVEPEVVRELFCSQYKL